MGSTENIGWLDSGIEVSSADGPLVVLRGWARDPVLVQPAQKVMIVDGAGTVIATAETGEMRGDVGDAFGDPVLALSGWVAEVPRHTVDGKTLHAAVCCDGQLFALQGEYVLTDSVTELPEYSGHLLVHQSGKVGSTTVSRTLEASGLSAFLYHVHSLSGCYCEQFSELAALPGITRAQLATATYTLTLARRCRAIIRGTAPLAVISGFRDPLGFSVSAFFEICHVLYPSLTFAPERVSEEGDFLISRFLHLFAGRGKQVDSFDAGIANIMFDTAVNWFEREFGELYGVDVYSRPVQDNNLMHYRTERCLLTVYRYESLRHNLHNICLPLSPNGVLEVVANEASAKPYRDVYRYFKENLPVSAEMHEFFYGSRFYRHFYDGKAPQFPVSVA